MNLNTKDYEILKYLYDHSTCDNLKGLDHFGVEFEHRISRLKEEGLIHDLRGRTAEDDPARYLGLYVLSSTGRCELTDYQDTQRNSVNESQKQFYREIFLALLGGVIGFVTGYFLR